MLYSRSLATPVGNQTSLIQENRHVVWVRIISVWRQCSVFLLWSKIMLQYFQEEMSHLPSLITHLFNRATEKRQYEVFFCSMYVFAITIEPVLSSYWVLSPGVESNTSVNSCFISIYITFFPTEASMLTIYSQPIPSHNTVFYYSESL